MNAVNEALIKLNPEIPKTPAARQKTSKTKRLVNVKQVKRLVLDLAERNRRAARFTRVGSDVYDRLEAMIRKELVHLVTTHPSNGRTIRYTDKTRHKEEDV